MDFRVLVLAFVFSYNLTITVNFFTMGFGGKSPDMIILDPESADRMLTQSFKMLNVKYDDEDACEFKIKPETAVITDQTSSNNEDLPPKPPQRANRSSVLSTKSDTNETKKDEDEKNKNKVTFPTEQSKLEQTIEDSDVQVNKSVESSEPIMVQGNNVAKHQNSNSERFN